MWARVKAAPAWAWALVVGLLWVSYRLWRNSQTSARLAAIQTKRVRVESDYTRQLVQLDANADAEREVILRAQQANSVKADLARSEVTQAAAKDQQAFVDHWERVWPK